jgi:hypothetical protein
LTIRRLRRCDAADVVALARIQRDPGPRSVEIERWCEEHAETSWVAREGDVCTGYLLAFVRDREAHCVAIGAAPRSIGVNRRVALVRALLRELGDRIDVCWLTVAASDVATRVRMAALGATEIGMCAEARRARMLLCIERRCVRAEPERLADGPPAS